MKIKSIFAVILVACLLCGMFAACTNGNGVTTDTDNESESSEILEKPEDDSSEESTTYPDENGGEDEEIVAKLPEDDAELVYAMYDGYLMSQYAEADKSDYLSACKYYEEQGYTLYSSNTVGTACSSVYVSGDAYVNVMFNENKQELYLGESEKGASSFPTGGDDILVFDEPTVTQHYSPEINGMCYFIKLSDGSFIVVDGGYAADLDDAYSVLADLNGSGYGIHIRTWIITHSHADHYEMFDNFSRKYAANVTLDTVMFSPLDTVNAYEQDKYLNGNVYTAASRLGAETCHVFAGMSFIFGDVTLEILASPEHIYKTSDPMDFNETSVVFRIRNDEGSMIFLGDSGSYVCDWLVDTYGEALKSDMVQLAHHGCETATIEVYQMIAAETLFWPSSESLLNTTRGGEVKQYIIEAESSKEYLLHGFGNFTRPLSYKPDTQYFDLMPDRQGFIKGNASVDNVRIEDGVIKYEVINTNGDPYIYIDYRKSDITTTEYNALKIVVGAGDAEGGTLFFSTHNDGVNWNPEKYKYTTEQGASTDDKTTIIIYLGDVPGYSDSEGEINFIRFDLGSEDGQAIEIYSIEAFKIVVDD